MDKLLGSRSVSFLGIPVVQVDDEHLRSGFHLHRDWKAAFIPQGNGERGNSIMKIKRKMQNRLLGGEEK